MAVMFVTILTLILWCSEPSRFFGNNGIVSIVPIGLLFGAKLLDKDDFASFPWSLIILTMGGSALGEIVSSSGLLDTSASLVMIATSGCSVYGAFILTSSLVMLVACFVSHTVGALVLVPVMQAIGGHFSKPHERMFIMATALACSAGMALPTSSFPNMNAMSQEDPLGRHILSRGELVTTGIVCSLIVWLCIVSIGYWTMSFMGF